MLGQRGFFCLLDVVPVAALAGHVVAMVLRRGATLAGIGILIGTVGALLATRLMAKLLCGVSIENSLSEHLQLERHGIADSMATEDLRSGVTAFFAGEEPEFNGH